MNRTPMNTNDVLPPGQHPNDPLKQDIEPIGFAMERVQTFLTWINEHRASFEQVRETEPSDAENELHCLKDSTEQAVLHLHRLIELILAGYSIDPNKRLPKGLFSKNWLYFVEQVRKAREKRLK